MRTTQSARPRASFAGWMRAQCGVYAAPSTPSAATRSRASDRSSQTASSSVAPQRCSSATDARTRSTCAGEVAKVSVPPLWKSARSTPPGPRARLRRPWSASPPAERRPRRDRASRAIASRPPAKSAEHQPPLRPDAPKPAISCSMIAIRRWGSARKQVVGGPEPGVARADDRDVDVDVAVERWPRGQRFIDTNRATGSGSGTARRMPRP